jgi:hypothetical protein
MKKHIDSNGFKNLTESLRTRIIQAKEAEINAMLANDSVLEKEFRARLSSYELALFSINLNSSVVEEKDEE